MANIELIEGSFTYTFIDVDVAEKYDEWAHYRNQYSSICGGSKAVDFICVVNGVLWLIEAKDYSKHPRTKTIDFAEEVIVKARDTLAGIVSAKFNGASSGEVDAAKKALRSNKIRIALHLEQPLVASRLRPKAVDPAAMVTKLRQLSKAIDAHPIVFDRTCVPAAMNLMIL